MRGRAARLKTAGLVLLLAASPAAAQEPGPTGMWEGRWKTEGRLYQVADDVIGLAPGNRQLEHEGRLEARFDFCVAKDGSVTGSGTARVKRNGSAKLVKPYEERWGGVHSDARQCKYTYAPTEADGPIRVLGQMQGEEFRLYLDTTPAMIDLRITAECISWDPFNGQQSDFPPATNIFPSPLAGMVGGASPLTSGPGFTIPARDRAAKETEGFDAHPGGNWTAGFSTLSEHRTRVEIRRPRADLQELPILLGPVFEPDLADVPPKGAAALEQLLPRLRCSGSAQIDVTVKDGSDELFLETLAFARQDALERWFAERGTDASLIDWSWQRGPQDRVQVTFD